jgi:hypothetical protein
LDAAAPAPTATFLAPVAPLPPPARGPNHRAAGYPSGRWPSVGESLRGPHGQLPAWRSRPRWSLDVPADAAVGTSPLKPYQFSASFTNPALGNATGLWLGAGSLTLAQVGAAGGVIDGDVKGTLRQSTMDASAAFEAPFRAHVP